VTDDVEQLVAYRLGQARETLEAGRALLDAKHYRDAINRAYYAMFYAALHTPKTLSSRRRKLGNGSA